ncbi:MAG TPA: MMPL family transporter [Streptosporangiaceae bacterium]
MDRLDGAARLVCGRWTKWFVLVAWLLVAMMVAGPLAGKLTGVQKNDAAQWLPAGAEATQVYDLQRQFRTADIAPAVIVYERAAGLTQADRAKVAADARALGGVDGVAGQVVGPLAAADGKALQLVVPIAMGADGFSKIAKRVDAIREITGKDTGGLAAHIAGPAGYNADSASAFGGADKALLFGSVLVVVLILLLTYRSPVLWLLPVICAGMALTSAQAVIYLLAKHAGLTVNAQSAGILTVLVFGAGTDYALLLLARYREELRRHADRHVAMAVALRRAGPAIIASAATVMIGLLCLLFADVNSTRGLGPVTALGIGVGLLAAITLLPALLVIFGRWVFWPVKPRYGSPEPAHAGGWARLGGRIAGRPRIVWVGTAVVLGVLAVGLTQLNTSGLSTKDSFVDKPDSVVGQEALARHFPAGDGQPVVVIGKAAAAGPLRQAVAGTDGIAAVGQPVVRNGFVSLDATLRAQPDSAAARATVLRVRDAAHAVRGADAKVGGQTALTVDLTSANNHDNKVIIPLVLAAVLIILWLLLRAVVAPLVLIATVGLSFAAALGTSAFLFTHVFGFPAVDTAFPLLVFVFLVALGVDYNIFLMTRVREESVRHGPRRGALIGLAATGGVISSAGLVVAATFGVLGSMPLVFFTELGVAVAFGVLLDTFVVRSVLVTALNLDLGRWTWWPGRLAARRDDLPEPEPQAGEKPALVR